MCDAIVAALEHDDEEGNRRQPHLEEDVMCSALLLELRSNCARTAAAARTHLNFNFGRALRDGGQTDLRTVRPGPK